jgi:hypothetical protein
LRWKQRLPVDRRARATGIVGGSMLAGNRRRRWLKLSGNRALRWPRRSRATARCTVGPMLRATGAAVTASLGQPCEAKRMLGQPGTPRRMLGQPSKRSSSCGGNFGARLFRGARIVGQPAMTTPQRAARASCGTTARCSAVRDRPIAKATLRSRLRSHRDPLVAQATARRARFEDLGQPRKASKRPVRSAGNCGVNANDARSGKPERSDVGAAGQPEVPRDGAAEQSEASKLRKIRPKPDRSVRAPVSGDRALEADRGGNSAMQAVVAFRLELGQPSTRRAHDALSRWATSTTERGHDKLFVGATGEESVERKLEARATANRERGRDEAASRGTARTPSSRKQTHRVGNQAVRACDTNSCGAAQPRDESVVRWDRRSGNRWAGSSRTKSQIGGNRKEATGGRQRRADRVTVQVSSTRDAVRRDDAAMRATGSTRAREARARCAAKRGG